MDIELNSELLKLVQGKRVVLVGPAPYLLNTNMGPSINEYDVIGRVNDIIPSEDLQSDYGNRTDIMFHNCGTVWMPGLKRKIEKAQPAFENLKMVVCGATKAKHTDTAYLQWPDNYVSDVVKNFESLNQHQIPFYWVGVKDYRTLYNRVGVEINSGMAAIMILLHYPIKELLVTGFTFFLGGTAEEDLYYKGHWDEAEADRKTNFGISSGHGRHANERQIVYFKELLQKHQGTLYIDDKLKELLSFFEQNTREKRGEN
tara:strand:- start:603 stop:1376 length:774 start_codon:yes stop_codon:yes gene_type:complete